MVSSGGASSGSEGQLRAAERRQKRKLSNRESARRSRVRKQKYLDDLMAQVGQLRRENSQIRTTLNITTQHYLGIEAENSVLRTQMTELSHRLQSLHEILRYVNGNATNVTGHDWLMGADELMLPWGNQLMAQASMASLDMFQYCSLGLAEKDR